MVNIMIGQKLSKLPKLYIGHAYVIQAPHALDATVYLHKILLNTVLAEIYQWQTERKANTNTNEQSFHYLVFSVFDRLRFNKCRLPTYYVISWRPTMCFSTIVDVIRYTAQSPNIFKKTFPYIKWHLPDHHKRSQYKQFRAKKMVLQASTLLAFGSTLYLPFAFYSYLVFCFTYKARKRVCQARF